MKTIFKIRRKYDGLFSTGGTYPMFNERGKTWNGLGAVRNHINLCTESANRGDKRLQQYLSDIELVEFEIVELQVLPLTNPKKVKKP